MTNLAAANDADRPSTVGERSTRQKRALAGWPRSMPSAPLKTCANFFAPGANASAFTTVYDQLRDLADAGDLDVLRNDSGELLFRQCRTGAHHHHLLCRVCGQYR